MEPLVVGRRVRAIWSEPRRRNTPWVANDVMFKLVVYIIWNGPNSRDNYQLSDGCWYAREWLFPVEADEWNV